MAGLRKAEVGRAEVLVKRGWAFECWEDERFTSLLEALRWLDGRGSIGLEDPLKEGVTGLLVDWLSVWKETVDSRRSQLVDGRRECDSVDGFAGPSSGIRKGGLVNVWPRRRSLVALKDRDVLRRSEPWHWPVREPVPWFAVSLGRSSTPAWLGQTDREVLGRTSTGAGCEGGRESYGNVFRRNMLGLVLSTRPRARPLVAMPTVLNAQS